MITLHHILVRSCQYGRDAFYISATRNIVLKPVAALRREYRIYRSCSATRLSRKDPCGSLRRPAGVTKCLYQLLSLLETPVPAKRVASGTPQCMRRSLGAGDQAGGACVLRCATSHAPRCALSHQHLPLSEHSARHAMRLAHDPATYLRSRSPVTKRAHEAGILRAMFM